MALTSILKEKEFGVGDKVRVTQKIEEGGKERLAVFEGMVISIHGHAGSKSFTVRRIGEQNVGIERIFPLASPTLEKIEVVKKGTSGVRHSKLYYTRGKSAKEIELIYTRASRKGIVQPAKKKRSSKKK